MPPIQKIVVEHGKFIRKTLKYENILSHFERNFLNQEKIFNLKEKRFPLAKLKFPYFKYIFFSIHLIYDDIS